MGETQSLARLQKRVLRIREPPCLPRYNWSRAPLSPPSQALLFLHRPHSLKTPICFSDFTQAPALSSAPALSRVPAASVQISADSVFFFYVG